MPDHPPPLGRKGSGVGHGRETQKLLFLTVSLLGLHSPASFAARTLKAPPSPPLFHLFFWGGDDRFRLDFGLWKASVLKVLFHFRCTHMLDSAAPLPC